MTKITKPIVRQILQVGLIFVFAFAVATKGAHDLWSFSAVCFSLTILMSFHLTYTYLQKETYRHLFILPFLFFLGSVAVGFSGAFDRLSFQQEFWGWFFVVVSFYLFLNTYETEADCRSFWRLSSWMIVPLFLVSLFEITRYGWGHLIQWPFTNSNVLAGFLLLLCFIAQLQTNLRIKQTLTTLAIILILLTRSWSAVMILFFLGGLFYRHAIKRKGILVCSLLTLFLIVMKWQVIQNKLNGWARLEYWKQALDILKDHPLTGVGLGGYAVAAPYYSHQTTELSLYAHNSIVEFVCETGLIGIVGLLAVIFVIFRYIRKQPKTPASTIYPFLIATLLLYSFLQITLSYWIFKWLLILFIASWLLSKKIDKDKMFFSANYSSILILAAGVLVLLIPFWLAPWVGSRNYVAGVSEMQDRHPEAAAKLFQNAIQINPHDGDAYWGLYMLRQNPSQPDCDLLNKAYSRKKLKAFAKERERCLATLPELVKT